MHAWNLKWQNVTFKKSRQNYGAQNSLGLRGPNFYTVQPTPLAGVHSTQNHTTLFNIQFSE